MLELQCVSKGIVSLSFWSTDEGPLPLGPWLPDETIVSTLILSTFRDPKKKENLIFYEGSI